MEKKPPLQLDHFVVNKQNISWIHSAHEHPSPELPDPDAYAVNTSLQLFYAENDEYSIAMHLAIEITPPGTDAGIAIGYEISVDVFGTFRIAEHISDENRGFIAHVNSATILYGIIRGIIAQSTGVFPGGAFFVPTLDMSVEWDKQRQRAKEE